MIRPVTNVGQRVENEDQNLDALLRTMTREGELYERLPDNKLRCYACGHRCLIPEGRAGVCRVRFNAGGRLMVPTGYAGALQLDPIEKKPFFHALPGTLAFSFGMLGCDFHCTYCQNWITSQTLRDANAGVEPVRVTPEQMVRGAQRYGARTLTSTYNEPLITSEWAVDVFKAGRAAGLATSYVSNGNATPEVLDYLRPWVDFYKVDLKGFSQAGYRQLGGKLDNVLASIPMIYERGFWLEIVTLVVPGFNDSEEELRDMARFIRSVSPDIPWHATAFHRDYKMQDRSDTSTRQIVRAAEIGYEEGLHFVYAGNRPGETGNLENTYCPACHEVLVERTGYTILANHMGQGRCPKCQAEVPGVWRMEDLPAARECWRRDTPKIDIAAVIAASHRKTELATNAPDKTRTDVAAIADNMDKPR